MIPRRAAGQHCPKNATRASSFPGWPLQLASALLPAALGLLPSGVLKVHQAEQGQQQGEEEEGFPLTLEPLDAAWAKGSGKGRVLGSLIHPSSKLHSPLYTMTPALHLS